MIGLCCANSTNEYALFSELHNCYLQRCGHRHTEKRFHSYKLLISSTKAEFFETGGFQLLKQFSPMPISDRLDAANFIKIGLTFV